MRIASGVAAALAELHRLRICHGDVYAHNVLAAHDGHAVLLDYGDPASTATACTHAHWRSHAFVAAIKYGNESSRLIENIATAVVSMTWIRGLA